MCIIKLPNSAFWGWLSMESQPKILNSGIILKTFIYVITSWVGPVASPVLTINLWKVYFIAYLSILSEMTYCKSGLVHV